MDNYIQWVRQTALNLLKLFWEYRSLILRGLFCLLIGSIALWLNNPQSFDFRFRLRNLNKPSQSVVIIDLSRQEMQNWVSNSRPNLVNIKELATMSDSFYWDEPFWKMFLSELIELNPVAIGITFYFGPSSNFDTKSVDVLNHPKVFWSGRLDQEGRMLQPAFSQVYNKNIGLNDFVKDKDGIVRSFKSSFVQVPHLALRLAHAASKGTSYVTGEPKLINYQGPTDSYTRVQISDILSRKYDKSFFEDKVIVIGTSDSEHHILRTPLGELSRSEITANVIDNLINSKWIKSLPSWLYSLILAVLLVLCIYIVVNYPHSVSLVFFLWIGVTYLATSVWVFDTFYLWLPLISPMTLLTTTFIVFISYQLTLKDNKNWKLEQEKIYLTQVEELKDNFVSLFSHDLKTPIAKIQAICDRMLNDQPDSPMKADLQLLRRESQELHRYIQSILQITKVESKDFKIKLESFDINELTSSVIQQLLPIAKLRGQDIQVELEPLFLIEIDGVLIREVLLNIIENALKYSPEGATVVVQTYEKDNFVFVSVKDVGPGIPIGEQKKIFEKFYRGNEQMNKTKGSGLGLYLVKYFIELHGGEVWLESETDKGTEVNFSLPVGEV